MAGQLRHSFVQEAKGKGKVGKGGRRREGDPAKLERDALSH